MHETISLHAINFFFKWVMKCYAYPLDLYSCNGALPMCTFQPHLFDQCHQSEVGGQVGDYGLGGDLRLRAMLVCHWSHSCKSSFFLLLCNMDGSRKFCYQSEHHPSTVAAPNYDQPTCTYDNSSILFYGYETYILYLEAIHTHKRGK